MVVGRNGVIGVRTTPTLAELEIFHDPEYVTLRCHPTVECRVMDCRWITRCGKLHCMIVFPFVLQMGNWS